MLPGKDETLLTPFIVVVVVVFLIVVIVVVDVIIMVVIIMVVFVVVVAFGCLPPNARKLIQELDDGSTDLEVTA